MSTVYAVLFGDVRIEVGDVRHTTFRTSKVQALLAYLILEQRGRRERLADLLWPGMPQPSAQANLRQTLYFSRKLLRDAHPRPIVGEGGTLRFNGELQLTSDVTTFAELLGATDAHEHEAIARCARCTEHLSEAVALYQGDLLAGLHLNDSNEFNDWAAGRRVAYRQHFLDALTHLAASQLHGGRFAEAADTARRQLAHDSLREVAYQQLMQALAGSNRREAALSVYEACRQALADAFGMQPTQRTTALAERIQQGELTVGTAQSPRVRGYELRDEIGSGAFGVVYRAFQPLIERQVAIKVIKPQFANRPDFIRRFEVEAQTIAGLEHPHIVPLYDYWREPDGAFLVMRYMRGGNLEAALQDGSPWSQAATLRFVEQLGAALHAAHAAGIVHRDLKPSNILLDEAGNVYLSDFGIARQAGAAASSWVALTKSPYYTAPEQLKGEPLQPSSDIYTFCLLIFQLLTGRRPSINGTATRQRQSATLPSVTEMRPELPAGIDDLLRRATAIDPRERTIDARQLVAELRELLSPTVGGAHTDIVLTPTIDENPYKGLSAFQEADADRFFGRDDLVAQLVDRLQSGRFLAVIGPSGSGKSSVVRAGLLPRLRAGDLAGSQRWFIAEMLPGAHPLEELEATLLRVAVEPPASLIEPLRHDRRGLLRVLKRILPLEAGRPGQLLLLVDQFEELFTLADEQQRDQFLSNLTVALEAVRPQLRVVVTLRADFFHLPLQVPDLAEKIQANSVVVTPLTREELELAIRQPARLAGVRYSDRLVARLGDDVRNQPGILPLLQFALTELFERRDRDVIDILDYEAIGGVSGVLRTQAEAVFDRLALPQRELARQLLLRLVTLGEGVEDTRRRIRPSQLEALDAQAGLSDVIDAFGNARLLTFDRDPQTREATVEVAHEALLREWPRLRSWLQQSRDDIRLQRALAAAAEAWQAAEREQGFLLRGGRLDQFDGWAQESDLALSRLELDYLDASLNERRQRRAEAEARRRLELEMAHKLADTEAARAESEARRATEQANAAQRFRRLAVGLMMLLLLAIGSSVWALQQERRIAQQTRLATARELAAAAQSNLPVDPERSILLALAAIDTTYTVDGTIVPEAETVLHQAVASSHVLHRLLGHRDAGSASAWVTDVAFSPDGRRLVTASGDNSVKVWDTADGAELLSLIGDSSPYGFWGVAYSPDGKLIAAGSSNETVMLWDAGTGERNMVLGGAAGHTDLVNRLAFSPDSRRLASTSLDGSIRIWEVATGQILAVHSDPFGKPPWDVAFSPDGRQIASGGEDKVVTVRGDAGQQLIKLTGHRSSILGVAFSPDGQHVASGSSDGTARVWNLSTQQEIHILTGHVGAVWEVAFSPDGRRLATAGADGTAKIWDLATGKQRLTLAGHSGVVLATAFDPAGDRLATASKDQTARLWDLSPDHELFAFESGIVYDMATDGAQQLLATTSARGTATVWELASGQPIMTVSDQGLESPVETVDIHIEGSRLPAGVAISRDGRLLAVGNDIGSATLWDIGSGRPLRNLVGHSGAVNGVALSPDGRRLVTAGEDKRAKVWDVTTGEQLLTLEGHTEWVWRVFFSPDGTQIVTTSPDDSAILWDSTTGERLQTLTGHADKVSYAAFHPNGEELATAGGDGTVRIWNLAEGTSRVLSGHTSAVNGIAYSPDGSRLATADAAGSVRVWQSETGAELVTMTSFPIGIGALLFNSDGSELITANWDNTIRFSTLSLDELVELAQQRLTRSLTPEECLRFLHTATCAAD